MNLFSLTLASSIRIEAEREKVWQVFTDISGWSRWCRVCLEANTNSNFNWSPGQCIALRFKMAGLGIPFEVALKEVEPNDQIAWISTKLSVTAVRTFTFVDSDGGTMVTDHKVFRSPIAPLRLFYPRPIIRHLSESMLADLKTECERAAST